MRKRQSKSIDEVPLENRAINSGGADHCTLHASTPWDYIPSLAGIGG
jgi:hypothetical protein